MATVHFYEKPGCINNTRQKRLLQQAGHDVVVHDLLAAVWTPDTLRWFVGSGPVADWFNPTAPAIRDGAVVPSRLSPEQALKAMAADPLLIRRPLLEVDGVRHQGFDPDVIHAWIGLGEDRDDVGDLESCPM